MVKPQLGKYLSFVELLHSRMPHLQKCVFVDDLLAVTVLSCLGAIFVLVPPFNETFLRIPIALSLFFSFPVMLLYLHFSRVIKKSAA